MVSLAVIRSQRNTAQGGVQAVCSRVAGPHGKRPPGCSWRAFACRAWRERRRARRWFGWLWWRFSRMPRMPPSLMDLERLSALAPQQGTDRQCLLNLVPPSSTFAFLC